MTVQKRLRSAYVRFRAEVRPHVLTLAIIASLPILAILALSPKMTGPLLQGWQWAARERGRKS